VTNTGDVALTVDIDDDQYGKIADDYALPVGGFAVFTYNTTITADVTNVANATGVHQLGVVWDDATASVNVIHPDIDLTKVANGMMLLPA
jgi:hypothetical protein